MMRRLFDRLRWWLLGVLAASAVAVVFAQEPAVFNRGVDIILGNLRVSRGLTQPTGGFMPHYEATPVGADSNQTYSTDAIRYGWVRRTGMTSNRTDALPTAANAVAEFPGVRVGSTLFFVLANEDSSETITLNGASTGVTYQGGCATALAGAGAMMVMITFTNVTSGSEAVTAVCLQNME